MGRLCERCKLGGRDSEDLDLLSINILVELGKGAICIILVLFGWAVWKDDTTWVGFWGKGRMEDRLPIDVHLSYTPR